MNDGPNILLITFHDLGRFLGCYGVDTVRTPHIDRLAREGVRFENTFCTAPQCSPSRASLFTGRYPHTNGVMGLTHANFAWDLHDDERHLGQILAERGYRTALVGVHHESRYRPAEEVAARIGMERVEPGGRAGEVVERARHLLTEYAEGTAPFYLQVGFMEPHRLSARDRHEPDYMGFVGDYIEPDDSLGVGVPEYLQDTPGAREEVAELQGAVHHVDSAVGELLRSLEDLGLDQDTCVILTTDHGVALPRAKCSLYDPGLEVCLMLRYPRRGWTGGRVQPEMITSVDVLPTLLELVGVDEKERLQGRSFLPLLDQKGPYAAMDHVFGELTYHDYYDPQRCIRTETHKLIVHFSAARSFMDPSQSWRPRTTTEVPADPARSYHPLMELYDLRSDPGETRNLADAPEHRGERDALLRRLNEWMVATEDPLLKGAVTSPLHRMAVDALQDPTGDVELMGASNPDTD